MRSATSHRISIHAVTDRWSLIVIKDNGQREVEIELPHRYRVSPQIASAMKAIQGVVEVELV